MAINNSRSMNADLRLGATDGAYKNLTPDRGGDVEMSAVEKRHAVMPADDVRATHGFVQRTALAEVQEQYLK